MGICIWGTIHLVPRLCVCMFFCCFCFNEVRLKKHKLNLSDQCICLIAYLWCASVMLVLQWSFEAINVGTLVVWELSTRRPLMHMCAGCLSSRRFLEGLLFIQCTYLSRCFTCCFNMLLRDHIKLVLNQGMIFCLHPCWKLHFQITWRRVYRCRNCLLAQISAGWRKVNFLKPILLVLSICEITCLH